MYILIVFYYVLYVNVNITVAMKFSRIAVYCGAIAALALMTILSAVIGFALPALLSPTYTYYAAVILFMFFGSKMLHETYEMYREGRTGPSEELEETENEFNTDEKCVYLHYIKNLYFEFYIDSIK